MNPPPTTPGTAKKATISTLCDTLTQRTGIKYIPAIFQPIRSNELKVMVYIGEKGGPIISVGELLQRMIQTMTVDELRKMNRALLDHWQAGNSNGLAFNLWLIKRDLDAFVVAALLAIEGESDAN